MYKRQEDGEPSIVDPPVSGPTPIVDRNGCKVTIVHKTVSIYDANGKLLRQESIVDYTKENVRGEYASLDNFIRQWSAQDKKAAIRDLLRERGIDLEAMKAEQNMADVDDFDFICHVAFDKKPLTRRERANNVKKRDFLSRYSGAAREVLEALLDKYMNTGIYEIEKTEVLKLDPFLKMGKPAKIASYFGGKEGYLQAVKELEQEIYMDEVGYLMSNLTGFVKRLRDIMRNDAGINGDAQRIEQIAWMLFLKVYDAKEQDWAFDEEGYVSIIPEPCRWENWAHDDKSGSALTGDPLLNFVNNTLFPVLKGNDVKDSNGKVLVEGIKVDANTPIKKAVVRTTFADANQYMKDGVLLRQVLNVIDELDLSDYEESHAFGEIYETILKELQSAGSAGEFYTPRAVTDFMARMIRPQIGERMADFACGTGGFLISWLKELQKQVKSTSDAIKYGNSIYGIEKKQFPYMLCITNLLLHGLDVPRVYHDNALVRDVLDYTEADQFDVALMNPPYGGSEKADVKNHFPDDLASSETADLFMAVIMYRLKKGGRAAVILPDGFLFGTDNAKVNLKKKLLSEFNLHTIIRLPGSVFSPYTSITTNILFFDRTGPTRETWYYRLDMPEGYKHFSKTKPMKLEHFAPVMEWWNDRREISEDGFDKAKKFPVEQLTGELGYNLDQCSYPHEEEEILAPLDLIHRYEEQRASLNAEIDRVLAEITAKLGGDAL